MTMLRVLMVRQIACRTDGQCEQTDRNQKEEQQQKNFWRSRTL